MRSPPCGRRTPASGHHPETRRVKSEHLSEVSGGTLPTRYDHRNAREMGVQAPCGQHGRAHGSRTREVGERHRASASLGRMSSIYAGFVRAVGASNGVVGGPLRAFQADCRGFESRPPLRTSSPCLFPTEHSQPRLWHPFGRLGRQGHRLRVPPGIAHGQHALANPFLVE